MNLQHTMTEEGNNLSNVRLNRLSKLGYEYISNVLVGNLDTLPCSESFDNASAPAIRTFWLSLLRKETIWGTAGLIESRNSATSTSALFRSEHLYLTIL